MPSQSYDTSCPSSTQGCSDSLDLWTSEVLPLLPADLEQQARILGAFQRRRAIADASSLLRAVLASVLVATSLRHLACWAVAADIAAISSPAWHKRIQNCRAWLLWLLAEILATPPSPGQLRLLPNADGNILLVDATFLGQPGGSGDDWRLHTMYNFTVGRLVQVTLTDQSGGEHLGHYRLQPGDIVVADNGYGYRRSVGLVRKQQAHLVCRVRPATFPLEQASGATIDLVADLRRPGAKWREWYGWCRDADGERYRVRVIAVKLPPGEAQAAQRRARQNAQRHGRNVQAATLEVAGWVLVATTLEPTRWDAAAVMRLYRVRWQIERLFKRMKSVMQLGTIRGQTVASIEASVLAVLVAWALQEDQAAWVRHQLAHLSDETWVPSTWSLTVLGTDVLRQQVRGNWGLARLHAILPTIQRYLTSRLRRDREHQETAVRRWLECRPLPNLVIQEYDLDCHSHW